MLHGWLLGAALSVLPGEHPLTVSAEARGRVSGAIEAVVAHEVAPRLAVAGHAGVGPTGPQLGLSLRHRLLNGGLSPFASVGLTHGFGASAWNQPGAVVQAHGAARYSADIAASTFVQGSIGLAWLHETGCQVTVGLGYARLLGDSNVQIFEGAISKAAFRVLSERVGSGPYGLVSLGYVFSR